MATVIFKPTEACNARCAYCDVVRKITPATKRMSVKTLEVFFHRVNEFLLERPEETMEIVWHGGEPLVLGPDYFLQAYDFQQKLCAKTGHRVRHAIQTNLTLFSKRFADIFRMLGIDAIGTSYDPFTDLRGLGRNGDSGAYNRRFLENIRLVEREGFHWGVIYVVTRLSLEKPLNIFHFLTNLNPAGRVMFNPVQIYGEGLDHLKITPEELVEFLGAIFPTWWQNREIYEGVEPFASLKKTLLDEEPRLTCGDSGDCAHSHINVGPDGEISQCGRAFDWGLLDYGTIHERSFSEALADPQRQALLQRIEVLAQGECKGCRYWSTCHGGCPLDAWAEFKSFMHKSSWCYAKRGFAEKYFYPITSAGVAVNKPLQAITPPPPVARTETRGRSAGGVVTTDAEDSGNERWINPNGGLGDTLMLSGVLKQVLENCPSRKFNLVTRTKYDPMLKGHPAIGKIGHPPRDAGFVGCNYWDQPDYAQGLRPYQVLARMFGLSIPVPERLYVPWTIDDDLMLMQAIPWREHNILISPSSCSPRKQMDAEKWESLVARAVDDKIGVVQAGEIRDRYIRGSFSLLGLTSPKQAIALLRHFDVIVTSDNFLMHAAHLCELPAIVLWGPTDHRVYGYDDQIHFQAKPQCVCSNGCIGPARGPLYPTECPEGKNHCMNQIDLDAVYQAVQRAIARSGRRDPRESQQC